MGVFREYLRRWMTLFLLMLWPWGRGDTIARQNLGLFRRIYFVCLLLVMLLAHLIARGCMWLEEHNPILQYVMYRQRRAVRVHPVFVIAGPRTGSTVLHRALLDPPPISFKGPRALVDGFKLKDWLFCHSVCVRLLMHALEKWTPACVQRCFSLSLLFPTFSTSVLEKHPMRCSMYEENEIWMLIFFLSGVFVSHLVPAEAATTMCTFQTYTPATQVAIAKELDRCIQNLVLFHRITGEFSAPVPSNSSALEITVVLKSHGIHELEALSTVFRDPQASFIVLQRNPMDSAPSYRQLRKSCFAALTLGLNLASTAWKPLLDLQIESDVAYFQEEKRVLENEFAETKVKYQVQAVEQGRFKQTPATKLLRAGTWRGFPMAAVLYENLLIDRGQRVFEALFDAFGVGHRHLHLPPVENFSLYRKLTHRKNENGKKEKKEEKSPDAVAKLDTPTPPSPFKHDGAATQPEKLSDDMVDIWLDFSFYRDWLSLFHEYEF